MPRRSIDTEAHWTKSGRHGWVSGYKLHLVVTVAAVWIPLAAELTPSNLADNAVAPRLLPALPSALRFLLGATNYDAPTLREQCTATGLALVTSTHGRYPHTDPGVEVRRVVHALRSVANEHFNAQCTGIFDAHGSVPTRGLIRTRRWALGAVLVYQLTLLHRFEHGGACRVGLTAFLKAA